MNKHRTLPRVLLAATLGSAALAASAHDTWFEPLPSSHVGELRLALGTGDRFPAQEYAIAPKFLDRQGCSTDAAEAVAKLRAERTTATALVLRAPVAARSCWVQLKPFDITLKADKVDVYLKEVNATPAVRAHWAALRARGVPWKETYTKHARINLGGVTAQSAEPSGLALDMAMLADPGPVRVRDKLVVQVLRLGRPLAGFNVELRSELSPLGRWHQTDGEGRITVQPPLAGRWLLRGTDLAPAAGRPDEWESRFVTLAFDVAPAVAALAPAASQAPGRLP